VLWKNESLTTLYRWQERCFSLVTLR